MASHGADYVVEILNREINKNHDPDDHTLAKIILMITDIRSCKDQQMSAFVNLMEDCYDMGLPDIVVELFGEEPAGTLKNQLKLNSY